ncbi:hypothetical protein ACHWQZ_G004814 [Mnemiopsis leidyi]
MFLRLVIFTAFFANGESRFRLIDQNRNTITWAEEGLLLYNGGTVCDDDFNSYAADVICKDMGFPYYGSWRYAYIWPTLQSSYTITLDDDSGISWEWDENGVGSCQRFPSDKGTTSAEILGALTGILMILCLVQGYFLIRNTKRWMVLREKIRCFLPGPKKENTPDNEEIPSVVYNATAGACTADQHNDGKGKSTSKDGGEFDNFYGKVQSEEA